MYVYEHRQAADRRALYIEYNVNNPPAAFAGLLCILANACFFVNIFRILVTKLRAPHANEPAHFRKAVRATVVLLPLFGLHWLLTLYRFV